MNIRKIVLPMAMACLLASCGGGSSQPAASDPTVTSQPAGTSENSQPAVPSQNSQPDASSTPAASSSSKPSESSAPSGEALKPAPSGSTVNLNFWTAFGQTPLEAVTKAAGDFKDAMLKETGVTVNVNVTYEGSYDDLLSKIYSGFPTGNIPTLAIAYPDHVANYLGIGQDRVYELTPFMTDANIGFGKQAFLGDSSSGVIYDEDDFIEAYLDEGRHYAYDGIYSMPLMKSSEVMFYNVDAINKTMQLIPDNFLPDAPRSKPEDFIDSLSWDELIELCGFIKKNKSQILGTLNEPLWYDSDSNLFISKMYQEEIDFTGIDDNGKGYIAFESGEARAKTEAMVNKLAQAAKDGILTTKGVKDTYGSDAFAKEECVFTIGSSGGAGYNEPDGEAFNYAVTRVPASNDNPLYISQGPTMTILRNSTLSDEENNLRAYYAWEFAKYLTNPETNVYLCAYGSEGYVPVRYSAYETARYQQFLSEGELLAETAMVLQNKIAGDYLNTDVFVGSAQLRDQVGGILTQVFSGTKDTTAAITDAIGYAKTFIK